MKFKNKPRIIDAEQFWPDKPPQGVYRYADKFYVVTTHGQAAFLEPGDWVIAESNGKGHYPCKPDIFEMTYEPAE